MYKSKSWIDTPVSILPHVSHLITNVRTLNLTLTSSVTFETDIVLKALRSLSQLQRLTLEYFWKMSRGFGYRGDHRHDHDSDSVVNKICDVLEHGLPRLEEFTLKGGYPTTPWNIRSESLRVLDLIDTNKFVGLGAQFACPNITTIFVNRDGPFRGGLVNRTFFTWAYPTEKVYWANYRGCRGVLDPPFYMVGSDNFRHSTPIEELVTIPIPAQCKVLSVKSRSY